MYNRTQGSHRSHAAYSGLLSRKIIFNEAIMPEHLSQLAMLLKLETKQAAYHLKL
jgi:hypothetical protein